MTPHFNVYELTFSNTAVRLGIDNTPDKEALENLEILAEGLEKVRLKLDSRPIKVSSGYRCLELNRALKSKDTSAHVKGLAADFNCPSYGSIREIMEDLSESSLEWDQLIMEYNSWIHIAFPAEGEVARRQTFVIDKLGVRAFD